MKLPTKDSIPYFTDSELRVMEEKFCLDIQVELKKSDCHFTEIQLDTIDTAITDVMRKCQSDS